MIKTNYHTHTTFCDGKQTAAQMADAALAAGFAVLGFSAHAMYPFASQWHAKPEEYGAYIETVRSLQKKYQDEGSSIELLAGFEAEYLPPVSLPDKRRYNALGADYLIGSVHYISALQAGVPLHLLDSAHEPVFTVDGPEEEVRRGLAELFHGDGKKLVQVYYQAVRSMASSCTFDILGHIDLIRRRNGALGFFDEREPWYRRELEATAHSIAQANCVVEINTGGMARGGIETPYPSPQFLALLAKEQVPVVINSDAHTAAHIGYAFDQAIQAAKTAGYRESWYFSNGTWQAQPL